MRPIIRFAAASVAALILSGCSDESKHLLAPAARPNAAVLPPGGGIGHVNSWASDFVEISAGNRHTCARRRNGVMYCWGDNSTFEIGIPSTARCGRYGFGLYNCVPQPMRVTGSGTVNGVTTALNTATSLRAGGAHTCALAAGGVAWCWGSNWYGEQGDGTAVYGNNVASPTPVNAGVTFSAIDAGGFATCGIANTLLLCWGAQPLTSAAVLTPTVRVGIAGWGSSVSVGDSFSCAKYGAGWWGCWGENLSGELGADPTVWPVFDGILTPSAAANSERVEAGGNFGCADQSDGTIWCWGDNTLGQLGNGGFTGAMHADPVSVGAGLQLHGVTAGWRHACALDLNGAAMCWGNNAFGQVGNGQMGTIVRDPAAVVASNGTVLTFRSLAAAENHTCGIGTDNYIYCWGDNFQGQLGQPAAPQHGQTSAIRTVDP